MTVDKDIAINNKKAVVTGRNYCNILTTARALGEAGYEVEVLKIHKSKPSPLKPLQNMKPEAYSRYVSVYKEQIVNNKIDGVTSALIDMADDDKKFLIPTDDYTCYAVDWDYDKLSAHYVIPSVNGKQGEMARLMDKKEQKSLADKYDIPMLDSWLIKSNNGLFTIPDDVKYPCFIKPNISMKSSKSRMKKCNTRDELEATLMRYAKSGEFEILVEEFADIKEEYSILGLSAGGNVVSPALFKVIEGGHRNRKGVAIVGEIFSPNKFLDIIEKCNDFIKQIGYVGMFDIDLLETKAGDVYFVELNFRAGASTYALNSAGVNLYGMLADSMMLDSPINNVSINENKRFVSEKILMEEYARGDASRSKVKKLMASADVYFVNDINDDKPYKYFKKFYFYAGIMRIIYRLLDFIK